MRDPICVLKFGSSVLAGADDFPSAVLEIYREIRQGRKVVAVVSAVGDTTDRMLAEARAAWGEPDPESLARLLETGEAQAAARLGLALDATGVPARILDPVQIGLVTSDRVLDAEPLTFRPEVIQHAFAEVPVVVVPGFSGRRLDGRPSLLGRGGSDLTALFLAHGLQAQECRLLKDVDGLLQVRDDGTLDHGTRYATAHYDECLRVGGPLIQPKAVEFAAACGMSFRIARCGTSGGTLAGPIPSAFEPVPQRHPLRVALAGLGTVGGGVRRWLECLPSDFQIVGILVKNPKRHRTDTIPGMLRVSDPKSLLARDPDLAIELIGGQDTAALLEKECRVRNIHLVTANKQLLAGDASFLDALASHSATLVTGSASVGGSVPALETVSRLAANRTVTQLEGVINGTCNYILDRMHEGLNLDEALTEAQLAGMAEADPFLDISGWDCVYKLSLLATRGFGRSVPPELIERQGLDAATTALVQKAMREGKQVKLVAEAALVDGRVKARVRLASLPGDHPLAHCRREENALLVTTEDQETVVVRGKGAGRWPTTLSVVADVLDRARRLSAAAEIEAGLSRRKSA